MDAYLIGLRIVHILVGVFWVGSALLFFFIIQPAARDLGPTGGAFMGHVAGKKKLPAIIAWAGAITILAGILLFWEVSGHLDRRWVTSGTGLTFAIGGLAAVVAWVLGLVAVRPLVNRMGALGAAIQSGGGPPSEVQATEMQRLDARVRGFGRINTALLIFAVLAMAAARYL